MLLLLLCIPQVYEHFGTGVLGRVIRVILAKAFDEVVSMHKYFVGSNKVLQGYQLFSSLTIFSVEYTHFVPFPGSAGIITAAGIMVFLWKTYCIPLLVWDSAECVALLLSPKEYVLEQQGTELSWLKEEKGPYLYCI